MFGILMSVLNYTYSILSKLILLQNLNLAVGAYMLRCIKVSSLYLANFLCVRKILWYAILQNIVLLTAMISLIMVGLYIPSKPH